MSWSGPRINPVGISTLSQSCFPLPNPNGCYIRDRKLQVGVFSRYFPKGERNVIVFDMRNSALAHVLKTSLVTLKKAMLFVETSLVFRLSEVHIINASPLVNQIQTMLRPFIGKDLAKMIHVHMVDKMESFYEFIPREHLPKDYGGEATSLQELNDAMKEMMLEQETHLQAVEKQVVDEGKRAGRAKSSGDVFGVEGSFKKLEFD